MCTSSLRVLTHLDLLSIMTPKTRWWISTLRPEDKILSSDFTHFCPCIPHQRLGIAEGTFTQCEIPPMGGYKDHCNNTRATATHCNSKWFCPSVSKAAWQRMQHTGEAMLASCENSSRKMVHVLKRLVVQEKWSRLQIPVLFVLIVLFSGLFVCF